MSAVARLIGVGVGPGDPELLTLKAVRTLQEAAVVAHFAKAGNASNARAIVAAHLRSGVAEIALHYPVTTELPRSAPAYCDTMRSFYDASARAVAAHLDAGRSVAVICEGDPLFYGSYMHLHVRLAPRYPTDVIAGVTGMSGCWSAVGQWELIVSHSLRPYSARPVAPTRSDHHWNSSSLGTLQPRSSPGAAM